jgi:hypothetical protein
MCRSDLEANTRRGFRPCRSPRNRASGLTENLLQQEFIPAAPNRSWACDITYIRTTAGWRYLAIWIDLYSRRVVGWALGTTMETTFVLKAWMRATWCLRAKRSRSLRLWHWQRIPSTVTRSRYQGRMRTPRRMRASVLAMRKLIRSRSVAAEAVLSTERRRFCRPQSMVAASARTPVTHFESALGRRPFCQISRRYSLVQLI